MHTTHKHRYLRGSAIAYIHGRQQTDIIEKLLQDTKFLSDSLDSLELSLEAQNTELLLSQDSGSFASLLLFSGTLSEIRKLCFFAELLSLAC